MKNWRIWVLVISLSAFLSLDAAKNAMAEDRVTVDVRVPSPLLFPAPPQVVVIPGTYVYVVPDFDMSVLFYQGFWYCPQGRQWYRAGHYNGPWKRLPPGHAPQALVKLPVHFRRVPTGRCRISYRDLQANWREWERKKHWDNDKDWQAGLKEQKGNDS